MAETHAITRLLDSARAGDPASRERLLAAVYHELRQMAAQQMAREAGARTLQPTALVHEAYLRLFGGSDGHFDGRGHFFAAAAEAMRRIRVEGARKRGRKKRGEGRAVLPLPEGGVQADSADSDDPAELLAVHEVLDALAKQHPREAEVVKQRFFVGLSVEDTADVMGIAPRTVEKDWAFARAWLKRALM